MTLNLLLPESFQEVCDDFTVYESGTLKTVSTPPRNAEKNYWTKIAKSRGNKLTAFI